MAEPPGTAGPASDDPGRDETEEERDDRNVLELIQEIRVGALGVQVLFGFLLSLPFFAVKFDRLTQAQRGLYIADLLLAAAATVFFTAPVAYHRLVFRRHRKRQLTMYANKMAIAGLAAVGLSISGSVLLAISYIDNGWVVTLIGALTLAAFAGVWFVVPLVGRRGSRHS
ncbi:MAG TPA: DUF6328 family protein [Acidimicrobiales bacterium]|nr:DUF6328 family protein [Acidimicrobiales bacterium]